MTTINYFAAAKILELQRQYLNTLNTREYIPNFRHAIELNWSVWDFYIKNLGANESTMNIFKLYKLYLSIVEQMKTIIGHTDITKLHDAIYSNLKKHDFYNRLDTALCELRYTMIQMQDRPTLIPESLTTTSPITTLRIPRLENSLTPSTKSPINSLNAHSFSVSPPKT